MMHIDERHVCLRYGRLNYLLISYGVGEEYVPDRTQS